MEYSDKNVQEVHSFFLGAARGPEGLGGEAPHRSPCLSESLASQASTCLKFLLL